VSKGREKEEGEGEGKEGMEGGLSQGVGRYLELY
jgi:hypothetical protein